MDVAQKTQIVQLNNELVAVQFPFPQFINETFVDKGEWCLIHPESKTLLARMTDEQFRTFFDVVIE